MSRNLRPNFFFRFSLLSVFLFTTGCLRTRSEMKEQEQRQVMQEQFNNLQQRNADSQTQVSELQNYLRDIGGKTDSLQAQIEQLQRQDQGNIKLALDQNVDLKRRFDLLQEEMAQLQASVHQIQQDLAQIKAAKVAPASVESKASTSPKSGKRTAYDEAEEYFKQKDWKKAIVTYQKFRDEKPKNPLVSDAIYKIGVSFQELGMKDEARAFYDEAVAKYPSSEGARKSKIRLKSLK